MKPGAGRCKEVSCIRWDRGQWNSFCRRKTDSSRDGAGIAPGRAVVDPDAGRLKAFAFFARSSQQECAGSSGFAMSHWGDDAHAAQPMGFVEKGASVLELRRAEADSGM